MNLPLFTWHCIVALLALILIVRLVSVSRNGWMMKHRFFEIGDDREEFFVPGDRTIEEDEDEDVDCE